jgi:prepilin-type N-terminal cleavage/methylation domain-containing protein
MCRNHGFTLIELTLVVALIAVLTGMVVVRYDLASPRQRAISAARKLGRVIENYREKAIEDETLYALRLDLDLGTYFVCAPANRTQESIDTATVLFSGRLDDSLSFKPARTTVGKTNSPLIFFFGTNGILPNAAFAVTCEGTMIIVNPDSLINEISYDEK